MRNTPDQYQDARTMSTESRRLERAGNLIDEVLKTTVTGTRDRPRTYQLVDLALSHALEWMSVAMPKDELRGGSSHPTEIEDELEARRLGRQIAKDVVRLPELALQLERDAAELQRIVVRLTQVIDHDKLPPDSTAPGCRSCARRDGDRGGHFEHVYPKAKGSGLCRWCYDYAAANGTWPPVPACDIRHRLGPRHATLWMKKTGVLV